MMNGLTKAAVILGAVALAGLGALPAAAEEDSTPTDPNAPGYVLPELPDTATRGPRECVFFRTLYDWQYLNDTHVIIWAPSRHDPKLIELNTRCRGLRFTNSLGFFSRDSRLCSNDGDAVIVDAGGGRTERCTITDITPLTDEALASIIGQANGEDDGAESEEAAD